ncbi:hypothetical protein D3C80_1607950 [compost metagenome]
MINFQYFGTIPNHFICKSRRNNSTDQPFFLSFHDPHSIFGVVLLDLISGFGIIHSSVRHHTVHIQNQKFDLLYFAFQMIENKQRFEQQGIKIHFVFFRNCFQIQNRQFSYSIHVEILQHLIKINAEFRAKTFDILL